MLPSAAAGAARRLHRPPWRSCNLDQPVPILATRSAHRRHAGLLRWCRHRSRAQYGDGEFCRSTAKLIRLNFREGQDVERGQELAKIDPAIYQAQYDQAVAKKAQDEALLSNAQRDLERYTRLAATNAVPPQQADAQRCARLRNMKHR